MVDADQIVFDLEHDLLSNHMVGNHIAVAVIRYLAVFIDFAKYLYRGIIIRWGKFSQRRHLLIPPLVHWLTVGSMDPFVCSFIEPCDDISICPGDGFKGISPPEPFPDIVHRTLYFAFYPGTIGRTWFWLKIIMIGKMEKLSVKNRLSIFSSYDHILHIIIENLSRDALQGRPSGSGRHGYGNPEIVPDCSGQQTRHT